MRRLCTLLLSTSALLTSLKPAHADDMVWPQVGGWGEAWEKSTSNPAPPVLDVQTVPAKKVKSTAKSTIKNDDTEHPIKLTADEVIDNRELGIVTARGDVEAFQGRRHLKADVLNYNVRQDIITASGNVIMVEPTGEVTKADYMEITDDFATGLARQIRYLAADKSRVVAQSLTRSGGNRTDFDTANYTPCEPCKEHPEQKPLWEVDAKQVTHDQTEKTIDFHDAWFSVEGVPVLYTPFMSTADPSVKRQSGFLTPTVQGSSSLGESITTPYYLVVSPNEDITFFPRWMLSQITHASTGDTVDEAILYRLNLGVQERWTGFRGAGDNFFSITEDPETQKVRGMINAKGIVDLNDTWRAGYNILRLSDDTYALTYSYNIPSDKAWLSSRAYTEGFWQQDYAVIEAFSFQGITTGTDAATQAPWVMPHAVFNHVSSPGRWDDTWTLTTDTLTYMRLAGTSASRLVNNLAWNLPYRDSLGEDWKLTTSVRADGYHSDDYAGYGSNFTGRVEPQFAVNWKYPFSNSSTTFPQTISPLGMFAVSPNGGNSAKIPNEDSIDYELDDTNIFQPNRMIGWDRVEGGARGAYGLRWVGYTPHGSILTQFAQGWRAHEDYEVDTITGFNGSFSDYVARLTVDPGGNFRFTDRVRLDRNTFASKRNEVTVQAGPEALHWSASYYYFEKNTADALNLAPDANVITTTTTTTGSTVTTPYGSQQQLYLTLDSQISRYWSISASYQEDLATIGGPLGWRTRLIYNDDCFAFVGSVFRNFTYQNDYLAGYTFAVNIVLKTFGQMPLTLYSD